MTEQDGLICAYQLDGESPERVMGWDELREAWSDGRILWVHLNYASEPARNWVEKESGLDVIAASALLAEETRPRAEEHEPGLLVNLRGVNLNPGADPEDMVSIRLWIDERRVITTRLRRLRAIDDIREAIRKGSGPRTTDAFLDQLARRLTSRMRPVIDALEDRLAEVEDAILEQQSFVMRTTLAGIRQQAISLRRYIGPQREALSNLISIDAPWMAEPSRRHLRESADRVTRIVEDLDTIRERAAVVQDELSNRLSDSMNRRMYALSVIAGLFLPLGLITGLLGINVAGIPGADTPWAFAAVCAFLGVIVLIEVLIFRRLKWM
jgi:zinc transporter